MTKTINRIPQILLFSIPFLLLFSLFLFTQSAQFLEVADSISPYLILDLLLTIPLVYFLIIRKSKIPNTTVVPMIFIGLILGYYTLPIQHHHYLDLFKQFAVPLIELGVLIIVAVKVRNALKSFRANKKEGTDFYDVLKATCQEIVPGRMSIFLLSEISVIYYGFINWKMPLVKENEFTYHKKSGSPALFGALIFIVLVETVAVHIILLQWSHLAAIILSILSVYTGLQLLGFGRSLSKRPIALENDTLYLRYGILNESTIKLTDIESIELSRKTLKYDDNIRKFSLLGDLESHNVVIRCKDIQEMRGIYGINKTFTTLALHVDEKEKFKSLVESGMKKLTAKE